MARYTVFINGQRYRISMSDVSDYYYQDESPMEDIIHYEVELEEGEWNGTIYAWIENPSQHTLHLIEQNRCFITLNCRNFKGHGPRGYHMYGKWDPEDPRKKPEWNDMSHSSGLGRGSYRFHKKWSVCHDNWSLLNSSRMIQVIDPNDIEIPIYFNPSHINLAGYRNVRYYSETYKNPYLYSYYFDFRLALLTACQQDTSRWLDTANCRVYQTQSKITRLTFEI